MKAVIFDADGTLVDTNYQFVDMYYDIYRKFGITVPKVRIHRCVGMGSDRAIPKLISKEWYQENGKAVHEEGSKIYMEKYLNKARPFDKSAELCRKLKKKGLKLALASSSSKEIVEHYISVLGVDGYLDAVVTYTDTTHSKPHPEVFIKALEKLNVSADEACVVGDSVWDVQAAKEAGMPCIAVLSGGAYYREELKQEGACEIYEDVADLYESLGKSIILKS